MSNKFLQRAVSDVGINVGSVNVNTDTLEAKMETTNTSIQNLRSDETSTFDVNTLFDGSGSLVANTINSTTLDLGGTSTAKTIHFYGKTGVDEVFDILVSNDNSTYIRVQSIRPLIEPISSTFHYSYRMENLARYYRISNPHPTTNITSFQMFYNITK
jgi:hypothetical protein|tara:strand:+ start:68 stop:541 length:474 start_codon:yes stop_codon:yes gene_type:complete